MVLLSATRALTGSVARMAGLTLPPWTGEPVVATDPIEAWLDTLHALAERRVGERLALSVGRFDLPRVEGRDQAIDVEELDLPRVTADETLPTEAGKLTGDDLAR
jgi:hypothetical protein